MVLRQESNRVSFFSIIYSFNDIVSQILNHTLQLKVLTSSMRIIFNDFELMRYI